MDNAAKGLLIAGGILLAIMTLTIFMYGFTATSRLNVAQDEADAVQELTNFNLQYESYNKKRMYGVDVITVINKAVQNNKRMNAVTNPADRHYIDVIISIQPYRDKTTRQTVNPEFKNELRVTVFNKTTGKEETNYYYDDAVSQLPSDSSFENMRTLLRLAPVISVGEHHLLQLHNNGQADIVEDFRRKFVEPYAQDITQKYEDTVHNETETYTLSSALTNFKKAIFTCEKVEYTDEGRVKSIEFKLVEKNK